MNWCEDLKITYNCAKRIANEKFDKSFDIFEFEDMVKDFKKRQVLGFTAKEIEILVGKYLTNQMNQPTKERSDCMDKILNKCPICGYPLEYSALMQYSDIYKIKNNGELTKNRVRKEDIGSMECGYISCINCDFVTDCDLNCENYPYVKIFQKGNKLYYKK